MKVYIGKDKFDMAQKAADMAVFSGFFVRNTLYF